MARIDLHHAALLQAFSRRMRALEKEQDQVQKQYVVATRC